MKKHLTILLSFLLVPVFALAALDVTFSGSAIISVGGVNFTVSSATIDSITVGASSFDVVLSPGASFSVSSSDRKAFTITPTEAYLSSRSCTDSLSSITLAMAASHPGPSTIVTITPSSSACSGTSGTSLGGGSPGSAGGGSSVPTPVYTVIPGTTTTTSAVSVQPSVVSQATTLTQSQISAIISLLQAFGADADIISKVQSALTAVPVSIPLATGISPVFFSGLEREMSNGDVKRLQQLLNSDTDTKVAESGAGSPGNETEYFGSLTEKAVQKFQTKYGLAQEGDSGYGYVGPKTRAKLGEVFSQ